jgi:type IV secretory pathway component VirB8
MVRRAMAKVLSDNKEISEQIKRDTSRLDTEPLEKLKKKLQQLYMWIWILLGLSALLLIIILLSR